MRKKKLKAHRILALLMAFLMVFTMIPATSFAASTSTKATITMNSGVPSAKLYAWNGETKGETDFLADVTANSNVYTVNLENGDYVLEGYSEDGSIFYGSIVITVSETENSYQVHKVTGLKAKNEGWEAGTDYTISAKVNAKGSMTDRQAVLGNDGTDGSIICLYMDSVTVTYTPNDTLHSGYGEQKASATIYSNTSADSGGLTAELSNMMTVTVNAPAKSAIQIVGGGTYYSYTVYEPTEVKETEDGVTAVFNVPGGTALRIDHPNGVLTWMWDSNDNSFEIKDGAEITITEEQLHIGNSYDILRKGQGNAMDQADVRLNINEKGYMNMNVGDTFEINATRVWQAVYTYMNTHTGMPNFSYKAIDPITGEESDVVQIVSRDPVTWQADMTAVKEGTAIVLVTYDAMFDPMTMGGDRLSAIWPENTGVFVVTVGADGTSINTGMKINENLGYSSYKLAGDYIDAEMDILYYTEGTDGASYSFTPASGSNVTVLHPNVTDTAMKYSGGFSTEGVSVNEETGEVTLTGLTLGRHIVKVEKDGFATYQVISAKPVFYTITDSDGNAVTSKSVIKAGDTIKVTYTGLYNPAEKQSGVYNFTSRVFLTDDANNITYNREAGTMGVYTFNSTSQSIEVTIPENWNEDTITFIGGIATSAFGGPAGTHRVVDYDIGLGQNAYNAEQRAHLCSLPAITLNVKTAIGREACQLIPMDGDTVIEGAAFTMTASDGTNITVKEDGSFEVKPGTYTYTIKAEGYMYVGGELEVTAEGENQFIIEMNKLVEGAWDGETTKEPEKDDEGWYQISNAAEFIWYANAITGGTITEYNAILTNDIDLGGYPFTPINVFAAENTLDGNNKTIKNLYVNLDSAGYIKGIGGLFNSLNGTFQNATVEGNVTYRTKYEGVFVGSIAGYFSSDTKSTTGGRLMNVVSNVNLTVEPSYAGFHAKYYIGGLVGGNANGLYVKAKGTIENCINNGAITVIDNDGRFNTRYVGGLVGRLDQMINILDSANHGNISVNSVETNQIYIGGVAGEIKGKYADKSELRATYNSGSITLNKPSGGSIAGICPAVTNTNVDGCYNTGDFNVTVSDEDGIASVYGLFEKVSSGTLQNGYNLGQFNCSSNVVKLNAGGANCYYLNTSSVANGKGSAISEEEFKTVSLGQYLLATCDGYPEVYWKDANFHVKGEETGTVESNCLLNSATVYKCTNCGIEFAYGEENDASGHKLCTHTSIADVEACEFCEYLVEPTCITNGTIKRICQNEGCGVHVEANINAFGHNYCWHQTLEQLEANQDCNGHTFNEPKCNEPGLVRMKCTRCAEPIPSNYAVPTIYASHTVDDTTKKEVEGANYDLYNCGDCGATLRVYHTLDTSGDYPWVYDKEDDRFESTVKAPVKDKSEASITVENAAMGALISFDYGCNTGGSRWRLVTSDGSGTSRSYYNVESASYVDRMREILDSTYNFTYNRGNDQGTTTGNDFAWIDNVVVHVHVADPTNITEKNVIIPATCTEGGEIYNICSDCGMLTDVKITTEALGHDYVETVVPPTESERGYTEHVCQREGCEDSYRDNYVNPTAPLDETTIYFSVSHDDQFLESKDSGKVMALQKLEVPYFDLAEYGLEDYYLNESEEEAFGQVTLLHAFLYATEIYYYDLEPEEAGEGYLYDEGILGTEVMDITGGSGSLLLDQFWGMDLNLNYYLNYQYPLASEGWGATADQIVLTDGDVVTVAHFTSWNFYDDPTSVYNYIVAGEDTVSTSVEKGQELTLGVYRAGADMGGNYNTANEPVELELDVYYTAVGGVDSGDVTTWTKLGTTDENGQLAVDTSKLKTGQYIVAVAGRNGSRYTDAICSAPDGILLTVTGEDHEHAYGEDWMSDETQHWKECECGDKAEVADHSFEWIVDKEATETEAGVKHQECTVCHVKRSENTEIPVVEVEKQEIVRISGETRYETSFKVADALKEEPGIEKFNTVIVATGRNFADALSGSYLAAVKNAPILLTNEKRVADVHEYIKANLAADGTVYVLGGTAALPETVEAGLEGYTVKRLYGKTRYETNIEILKEAGVTGEELLAATGKDFADSLSASAVKKPILLVKDSLRDSQKEYLGTLSRGKFYIIGGTAAVSEAVAKELAGYGAIERLSGATRYETSVEVAEKFFADADAVVLAYAKEFPDGLCGGALAVSMDAPVILTVPGKEAAAAAYVQEQGIQSGVILGGTARITDESARTVFKLDADAEIIVK